MTVNVYPQDFEPTFQPGTKAYESKKPEPFTYGEARELVVEDIDITPEVTPEQRVSQQDTTELIVYGSGITLGYFLGGSVGSGSIVAKIAGAVGGLLAAGYEKKNIL